MSQVIEFLRQFNRKERFILLSHVLGAQGEEVFRLSPGFRGELGKELGLNIPKNAFVAMDYHLDWIQMALYLADKGEQMEIVPKPDKLINTSQRDIDLLVAFKDARSKIHLVLIEAKADTGWTNQQLAKKVERLRGVFPKESHDAEVVEPHFVLMSPQESDRIETSGWPEWMRAKGAKAHWLKLPLPDGLLKATRWDTGRNKSDQDGDSLFIRRSKCDKWVPASPKTQKC